MLGRIRITHAFDTAASPIAVWSAFEAAPRWPTVLTDLIDAHIEGGLTAGAIIRTVAKPGTKAVDMTYHVTVAEPARRLVLEMAGEDFRARTSYTIEATDTGARVTVTSWVEPVRWLHKLTTALTRRHYEQQFRDSITARTHCMLALAERLARGAE